ncbi:MAG: tetratricopeptide repeat protein [Qingshengfaniella sp.]
MRRRLAALGLALAVALPAVAQDRAATLADIRQQLGVLSVEIGQLRRELSTTGTAMTAPARGGALERLDGIEAELRRLTARSEELEHRIERIVQDGTNRIGDLQFRLTELEGGDLGNVPGTPPLGGTEGLPPPPVVVPEAGVELAVGEQADFETAMDLVRTGPPAQALAALTRFVQTYPRSPLTPQAELNRGHALTSLGDRAEAGRAYLEAFTLSETDDPGVASDALFHLGKTLAGLGQTQEACVMLGQVGAAYPGTPAASGAQDTLSDLTCP